MGYGDSLLASLVSQEYSSPPRRLQEAGLSSLLLDQDWRAAARCSQFDPDLFFAPGAIEHKEAKRICRDCPVRVECLRYAMSTPIDHGIWGGMTERERRRHRRQGTHLKLVG